MGDGDSLLVDDEANLLNVCASSIGTDTIIATIRGGYGHDPRLLRMTRTAVSGHPYPVT